MCLAGARCDMAVLPSPPLQGLLISLYILASYEHKILSCCAMLSTSTVLRRGRHLVRQVVQATEHSLPCHQQQRSVWSDEPGEEERRERDSFYDSTIEAVGFPRKLACMPPAAPKALRLC